MSNQATPTRAFLLDIPMWRKRCPKCGEVKDQSSFSTGARKSKKNPLGLSSWCRSCQDDRNNKPEGKRKRAESAARWYLKNKSEYRERQNKYYRDIYYPKNKDALVAKSVRINEKRYKEDLGYRLDHHIGSRLREQLKNKKTSRTKYIMPFTMEELAAHLEANFAPGMTWDNYGAYRKDGELTWHIDHVKPQSLFSFTSTDDPQFLECWSLDNLRPMWAPENMSKGGRNRYVA